MTTPEERIDFGRLERTGIPEVVFAESKTPEQIERIVRALYDAQGFALATRVRAEVGPALASTLPSARYDEETRLLVCGRLPLTGLEAGVICAGTSDLPVAREASLVLSAFGHDVVERFDVGVAGVHRLISVIDDFARCRVLVVVAGMEGALPSVVAGLVRAPVVAVPTSVGYGAAFEGLAALLTMLNSCAPGIAVVNIDNGFGAAAFAHKLALSTR